MDARPQSVLSLPERTRHREILVFLAKKKGALQEIRHSVPCNAPF